MLRAPRGRPSSPPSKMRAGSDSRRRAEFSSSVKWSLARLWFTVTRPNPHLADHMGLADVSALRCHWSGT